MHLKRGKYLRWYLYCHIISFRTCQPASQPQNHGQTSKGTEKIKDDIITSINQILDLTQIPKQTKNQIPKNPDPPKKKPRINMQKTNEPPHPSPKNLKYKEGQQ